MSKKYDFKNQALAKVFGIDISSNSALILAKLDRKIIVDNDLVEELIKHRWYFNKNGYVYCKYKAINKRVAIPLHQYVYYLKNKIVIDGSQGLQLDHINRNRADNRISNLRPVTRTQQNDNRKLLTSNKTGYQGVSLAVKRNQFRADFYFKNKRRNLGYYKYPEEAALNYLEAYVKSRGHLPPAYTCDRLKKLREFNPDRLEKICKQVA